MRVGEIYTYITSSFLSSSSSANKGWVTTEIETWKTGTTTIATQSTVYAVQINGWLLPSAVASTNSTIPAATTPTNREVIASRRPSDDNSDGLSQGSIIGIATSVSIFLVASILCGIFCFIRRRRLMAQNGKAKEDDSSVSGLGSLHFGGKPELDTEPWEARNSNTGLERHHRQYGDGMANLHEMPTERPVKELHASPMPIRELHGRSSSPLITWARLLDE